MLVIYALRIELGKSYRGTIDLLSEMPSIVEEIGLTRFPHYTVLRTWFGRISMKAWRAFPGRPAEKRIGHAAIDTTDFNRDQPSRHYANRTSYRVQALKVTALVDVETLYITDIHCTTRRSARRNAAGLRSLAADSGYDSKGFRDELRGNGVRPLIKHRTYSFDHAHNARMNNRYHQLFRSETVFSSIKCSSAPPCVHEVGN